MLKYLLVCIYLVLTLSGLVLMKKGGNPGKIKINKWENIKSLLKLAVVNNNLSKNEAKFLEEKFHREKL